MREKEIVEVDATTLNEDDLDEVIGSATRILRRLEGDKKGIGDLRTKLLDRIKDLKKARKDARLERKGR